MTRIIAGLARGRPLVAPRGGRTRPTSDKVRGALFNVLGQFFEGGAVVDLYAGSGALALEALSRGCETAVLVESDREAIRAILRNAEACGFTARIEVRRGHVPSVARGLSRERFTLAFVDPPYGVGPDEALEIIGPTMAPGGRVVAEHDARRPPGERYDALALEDRRAYGRTGISIYVRE